MSNFSQFAGGGGIKSIQRGTISIPYPASTADATITTVNTAKAELRLLGHTYNSTSVAHENIPALSLVNATTVRAYRATGNGNTVTVYWELTEWN